MKSFLYSFSFPYRSVVSTFKRSVLGSETSTDPFPKSLQWQAKYSLTALRLWKCPLGDEQVVADGKMETGVRLGC
jgi:hypothetical protein